MEVSSDLVTDRPRSIRSPSTGQSSGAVDADSMRCRACLEVFPKQDGVELFCRHRFCRRCIVQSVRLAIFYLPSWPFQCCSGPLDIADVRHLVDDDLGERYRLKWDEMEGIDRTYCADGMCGSYIPSWSIRVRAATCDRCGRSTCVECKEEMHEGDCAVDEVKEKLLSLARRLRWKRCPSCRHLVGKGGGCVSMLSVAPVVSVNLHR